ncbi:MAG TPA: hypothetical protein VGH65_07255 [Verrucomicrobiaceae bacterium]|jgi:N-formylglutamate amidohydrolase
MPRLLCILSLSTATALAQAPAPQFGVHEYIEYIPGDLPLVIGAPHGGLLKPAEIADRTYGKVLVDSHTQDMARALREALLKTTGGTPHLIICRLYRMKVDCNREIKEAAQGDPIAEQAWKDYQGFAAKATARVREQFGAGLYIDFHGQSHAAKRVELGYMISPERLRETDAVLDKDRIAMMGSSIRELDQRSPASFVELVRGMKSLGAMLEDRGFPCVPSPSMNAPAEGQDYFRGGYNTDTYGSHAGGAISALQIECPMEGVRDNATNRTRFIAALGEVLPVWFKAHFNGALSPKK